MRIPVRLFFVCAVFAISLYVVMPTSAYAAGNAADLMCNPVQPVCGCGQIMGPKGCIAGANMYMCPCFDVTNGFKTTGICVAAMKCQAQSSDGKPPEMPKPPESQPKPPGQDQPCAAGGSTGVNDFGASRSTSTSVTATSTPCSADGSAFNSTPFFDTTSAFNTISNSFGSTAGTDIVSSLLSGTISASSESNTSNTAQISGSIVPGASTSTAAPGANKPFGSGEGVSGDVQVRGNAVSLMVSNRDSARGTQVSGMYGYTSSTGVNAALVFKGMCSLRPWAISYISLIIPSAYFDDLCRVRGFAVGITPAPTAPVSTAPKTGTAATPTPAQSQTQPQSTGTARADIWAVPPTVAPNSKTSIFWDAKNVNSCSITSSDGAFSGSSLSGHASSQSLSKNTTFTISCLATGSTVTNQVVVTVQ